MDHNAERTVLVCPRCLTFREPPSVIEPDHQVEADDETDICPECDVLRERALLHPAWPAGPERSLDDLVAALRQWRTEQARVQRVERYLVLPNRAIGHLALLQPEDEEALLEVPGIGPAKARDYGYVLTRFFRELHGGGEPEAPLVVSSPIPEGLSEDQLDLLFAVRTVEGTLPAMAQARGLDVEALVDRLEALVRAGCADVVQILCSPMELHVVARHVEAGHSSRPGALGEALPGTSELARRLVPIMVGLRADDDAANADDGSPSTQPS